MKAKCSAYRHDQQTRANSYDHNRSLRISLLALRQVWVWRRALIFVLSPLLLLFIPFAVDGKVSNFFHLHILGKKGKITK